MKLYPKIWNNLIIASMILSIFSPTQAATLAPPSLIQVIKQNEAIQKRQTRKNRTPRALMLTTVENLSYHTIKTGKAITLSKYDTLDLWVQDIDLSKWWKIVSQLSLSWYDETSGEPLFIKKKLSQVASELSNTPFSIVNGQFFDPKRDNTPLSFWLKMDGVIRTAWADNRNEPKNILILEEGKAKIVPYSWENLRDAPGYLAMVNLSLEKWHYTNESIGRTYICLQNPNTQNESSRLLVFTAISMDESSLEREIIRWWCTRGSASKLDSSGSTRLWIPGVSVFGFAHRGNPDYREIPHFIAIYDWV